MIFTTRILIGAALAWLGHVFSGASYRNYHKR